MRKPLLWIGAVVWSLGLAACPPKIQQTRPDHEKVHQDHDEASEDLRQEEDKRQE